MPKRGQTQPWKVRFQYPGQKQWTIARHALPSAVSELLALRKRGAEVTLAVKLDDGLHEYTDEQTISGLREYGQMYDYLIKELEEKVWERTDEVED